ncbi:MAG: hypothetical protein GY854_04250 [Deltaproteobacteria bacterium]|nr:hypothetical protein [Deltaproteobacteria bacterium]
MSDQIEEVPGSGGGVPQAPIPADDDISISNTGQRVRAILVAIIALGAAGGALFWWTDQNAKIEAHEKARADFQKAHTMGYVDFWTMTQVDIKALKSNQDFETKMKQIISEDPVRYANYIKEKALPIIDKALPEYKGISVPSEYADKMAAMAKAAEGLHGAWDHFADELLKFEVFFKSKKNLDKAANAWLGAQQYKDDKYTANAFKYFTLLGCILPDQKIEEMETMDINVTVKNSCAKADAKTPWFRRVAYDCLPKLLEKPGEPNDAFAAALEKARGSEMMDHASKFGIEDCLKASRDYLESDIIEEVAKAWANYVVAQNELLKTIDAKLKKK